MNGELTERERRILDMWPKFEDGAPLMYEDEFQLGGEAHTAYGFNFGVYGRVSIGVEVFGAWQEAEISKTAYADPEEREVSGYAFGYGEVLLDEIADCIQACANLASALGVTDLTPYLARCEERNRERGRYDG